MRHVRVRACSVCYGRVSCVQGRDVEYYVYTAHEELCVTRLLCVPGVFCVRKYNYKWCVRGLLSRVDEACETYICICVMRVRVCYALCESA